MRLVEFIAGGSGGSADYGGCPLIKINSFRNNIWFDCGDTRYKERKSDWKSTPSCFKNIVEAISKSGLKDSLQQVDIYGNQTLKKDVLQAMFNELGMYHISVVEDFPSPIE